MPAHSRHVLLILLALVLLGRSGPAHAQQPAEGGKWTLTADEVASFEGGDRLEARGDARLVGPEGSLRADFIRYFPATEWAYLEGAISADFEDYTLHARTAEFDLTTRTGWLQDGIITGGPEGLRVVSERIDKIGEQTYVFSEATVTACPGETPAWSVAADYGQVTFGGDAELGPTRFLVEDVPVMYTPWAAFSLDRSRKSGLLVPDLGVSSEVGYFIHQPYYFAVDPEYDVTVHAGWFSDRGFPLGLEVRATPDVRSQGVMRMDWLRDEEIAPTEADEQDRFRGDGLVRSNRQRYWLRGKYDGRLTDPSWRIKADVDIVSDQNYLREFTTPTMSFDESDDLLTDRFGRGLDTKDDSIRTNEMLVTRDWENAGIGLGAQYNQNLAFFTDNNSLDEDPTVQRLPELTAHWFKSELGATGLELLADAQLAYLWRMEGTTSGRIDVRPALSYPVDLAYLTVIPEAGLRETIWGLDRFEPLTNVENASADSFQERHVPDARVQAFSEFFRVFGFEERPDPGAEGATPGDAEWTALRHAVQPRVEYRWVDDVDQDHLPDLDELDRIEPVHQVGYSLTNIIDRRRSRLVPQGPEPAGGGLRVMDDYREFLRVRVAQAYDIREATRDEALDEFERRPFTDMEAEVIVRPDRYVSLTSRTFISPYEARITEHEHTLQLTPTPRYRFSFGLDFQNEIDEFTRQVERDFSVLNLGTSVDLGSGLSVAASYRRDLKADEDLERAFSLFYAHDCYGLHMRYEDTPNEESFELWVDILGLTSPRISF